MKKMKEVLRLMQAMQLWLAERGVDAHIETTRSGEGNRSCRIVVFDPDNNMIVAECSWHSWCVDEFDQDWPKFESEVKDKFFGWWE